MRVIGTCVIEISKSACKNFGGQNAQISGQGKPYKKDTNVLSHTIYATTANLD